LTANNSKVLIYGIGTDIIEVLRIKDKLQMVEGLKETLFTPGEITYCESKKFPFMHFSGRFAAKEAFYKALGTGWRNGMSYSEIEVSNDKNGKPYIKLSGKTGEWAEKEGIKKIHVSISHIQDFANAMIILEI
jgi:holo-[acyl-carrier protein] synthase